MSEVVNPEDLMRLAQDLSNRIAKGVLEVTRRESDFMERTSEYDHAWARAFKSSTGTNEAMRKADATLDTMDERRRMDAATVLFRHAQRQARHLEQSLSTTQSLLRAVVSMYGGGGTGHGS